MLKGKPMSKMLVLVGIFFTLVFGWYFVKKGMFIYFMSHYQPGAVTVSVKEAKTENWQSYLTTVGSITAINGVDLSAEVAGTVKEIHFASGQAVQRGNVLVVLDTNLEEAALKNNQAKLALAKINYEREKTLFAKHVTPRATLDLRLAELKEAEANVQSVEAQIKQKTISAPFDGRLGIRQINLGEYLAPGKNIVTLQSLNPLYVSFSVPEQYLSQLYPNQKIAVTINDSNDKPIIGEITAINSKVSLTTRNVDVQATIQNPDLHLYPGMFAQVKIWLNAKQNTIVIPQTAVSYSLNGDYVFLIKEENDKSEKNKTSLHAYRQSIKVGERRDDRVAILEGLKPGDRIVTAGQLKLQNGAAVIIDNHIGI